MKQTGPGWLALVWLLLRTARRRARARQRNRTKGRSAANSPALYGLALVGALFFQVVLAYSFIALVNIGTRLDLENTPDHPLVLPEFALLRLNAIEHRREGSAAHVVRLRQQAQRETLPAQRDTLLAQADAEHARGLASQQDDLDQLFGREADQLARDHGGTAQAWRQQLQARYAAQGRAAFATIEPASFTAPGRSGVALLTLLLCCWWLSMVLQGEGADFDTTRRRHPMWEWYLAFPVRPSAVFTAEALAPIAGNTFLLLSPILFAILSGAHQDSVLAGLCALPVAIPLTVAAALWAKAIEVLIMLRCPVRNRSGWFAMLAVLGMVASFLPLVLLQTPILSSRVAAALAPLLRGLPDATILLGDGTPAGWFGALALGTAIGGVLALPAFFLLRLATAHGLESGFGAPARAIRSVAFHAWLPGARGGWRDPLLYKEWLWLKRDRGALVQLIGVPLILVAVQAINLQNLLRQVDVSWNKFAGVVVGLGGYLLFAAGPRALASEGPGLGLTLSWPRSLEDSLRMKVRLMLLLVSVMVLACLAVGLRMFPDDRPALLAVALVWPLFGLSVAEKAVTLIRQPSHSGESDPLPRSAVWAASLGNLTLAIALFTAQWSLAIAALVLNGVYASAIWQGFRLRLAYLFDAGAQPRLRPPTLLSSIVATVVLLEFGAIAGVLLAWGFGADGAAIGRAIGYAGVALLVVLAVLYWHAGQDVGLVDIVYFEDATTRWSPGWCAVATVCGLALGTLALGYLRLLPALPWPELHEMLARNAQFLAAHPQARLAYAFMAIGVAPWVEEFIFRGLMFRAMLAQWGMVRAVLLSSAFFTVLHPPASWPMVFLLGAGSALLFQRSRSLLPCVLLHASYNALVIGAAV